MPVSLSAEASLDSLGPRRLDASHRRKMRFQQSHQLPITPAMSSAQFNPVVRRRPMAKMCMMPQCMPCAEEAEKMTDAVSPHKCALGLQLDQLGVPGS